MTFYREFSTLVVLIGFLFAITRVWANSDGELDVTTSMDRYSFELMAQADEIYTTYESLGEYTTLSGKPIVTDRDYIGLKRKLSTFVNDVESGIATMREQSARAEDPQLCQKGIEKFRGGLLADFKERTSDRAYVENGFENELAFGALALAKGFGSYVWERCRWKPRNEQR